MDNCSHPPHNILVTAQRTLLVHIGNMLFTKDICTLSYFILKLLHNNFPHDKHSCNLSYVH